MTADEALKTGILVSIVAHALLFLTWDHVDRLEPSSGAVVTVALEGTTAVAMREGGTIMEARVYDPREADEAKAVAERRRRYRQYLQDVSNEIHAQRLRAGGSDLIGLCEVRFAIDESGTFFDIRLHRSSGNPALDRAALRAVRAASGRVKRPAGIAEGVLNVAEEVRFQYALE